MMSKIAWIIVQSVCQARCNQLGDPGLFTAELEASGEGIGSSYANDAILDRGPLCNCCMIVLHALKYSFWTNTHVYLSGVIHQYSHPSTFTHTLFYCGINSDILLLNYTTLKSSSTCEGLSCLQWVWMIVSSLPCTPWSTLVSMFSEHITHLLDTGDIIKDLRLQLNTWTCQ